MKPARFTLMGDAHVEGVLDELVQKASRAVLRFVLKDNLKALILAGSYGRGEGGIATRDLVQHPSGTLDLILLVVGLRSPARQKLATEAEAALATLRRRYLVNIDLSVVDAHAVERDRVSVRWHDARHGHRHLAGDPGFLPGLARFTEGALDRAEAFDLIVHHGGLLVLNDVIRASGPLTPERREVILKQAANAVLGFGDAFLLRRTTYHWSEVERARRMGDRATSAPPDLKSLYAAAANYRWTGDPIGAERLMFEIENGHLKETLGRVHLELERRRLQERHPNFEGFVSASLREDDGDRGSRLENLARGALTLVRSRLKRDGPSTAPAAGPGLGRLRALLPLVLYGLGDAADAQAAREILGVRNPRSAFAKASWLRMWDLKATSHPGDTLRRLGISIDVAA